ncbi:MAG: hypothetical protein R3D33_11545 [Hyphomicrobiaceae bacterium]
MAGKLTRTLAAAAVAMLAGSAAMAVPANAAVYGCYEVRGTSSLNIRAHAWSHSDVVGVARRGDLLVKWKMFCSLRGFWCPVEKDGIRGHADKRYLRKVTCPW